MNDDYLLSGTRNDKELIEKLFHVAEFVQQNGFQDDKGFYHWKLFDLLEFIADATEYDASLLITIMKNETLCYPLVLTYTTKDEITALYIGEDVLKHFEALGV